MQRDRSPAALRRLHAAVRLLLRFAAAVGLAADLEPYLPPVTPPEEDRRLADYRGPDAPAHRGRPRRPRD